MIIECNYAFVSCVLSLSLSVSSSLACSYQPTLPCLRGYEVKAIAMTQESGADHYCDSVQVLDGNGSGTGCHAMPYHDSMRPSPSP